MGALVRNLEGTLHVHSALTADVRPRQLHLVAKQRQEGLSPVLTCGGGAGWHEGSPHAVVYHCNVRVLLEQPRACSNAGRAGALWEFRVLQSPVVSNLG